MADRGIVIGIENYPGISDLAGPCNDAERFANWLIDPDKGGLDSSDVALINSRQFPKPNSVDDARPVLSEVNALFRPLVTQAANGNQVDDRLFIFAAGHGFADPQDMSSAAVYTAEASQFWSVNIAINNYAQFLRRQFAFREIILIVDACRTTFPTQRIERPQLPELDPHPYADRVKLFQAYATGFGKESRERHFGAEVRGIFTEAIMDALNKAVPNRLGRVTGSIVSRHVHNVIDRIAATDTVAPPEIVFDENRDALFIERDPPATDDAISADGINTLFATQDHHQNQTLILETGSPSVEVGRVTIQSSPTALSLLPGIYKAVVEETGQTMLFEVPGNDIVSL
ncbi:caspase family protein [uncultured Roseobacter sp.]|uniref:caspase family protein n=1 Tax=uncultured Roseobacter sp. TaxID=114847 RepID=UPI00261B21F9|nr:caspase family protein [uncultured Roseobacter sp.]